MYFGSVRFFKNLIFAVVVTAILIPTFTTFHYKAEYQKLANQQNTARVDNLRILDEIYFPEKRIVFAPDTPAYQEKYPDFYAPQPLDASEAKDKTVYFTFDDGPSARTYEVLDILAGENIKATFFVVGKTDAFSRQAMKDIVAQGHTLAMHTYSHEYKKIYSSVDAYLDDMYQIFTLIKETTGTTPTFFRFAGGSINSYNMHIYQEIISEMLRRGFIPCDWNVSSGDASSVLLPVAAIEENVLAGVAKTKRAVVLMHDSSARITSVQALPAIIQTLKEQGYSFDRLTPQTKPVLFAYN